MPEPRRYGPVQRRIWERAMEEGITSSSFAAYLDGEDIQIAPSLVRQWMAGDTHMPVDVLVHLAHHADDAADLLRPLLDAVGLRAVPVEPRAATGRDVVAEVADVARVAGQAVAEVATDLRDGRLGDVTGALRRLDEIRRELDEAEATVRGYRPALRAAGASR